MTARFAPAVTLMGLAANPHVASILEAFRQADAMALQVLPTILNGIDPESPMTELVEGLVARAQAGEALSARDVVRVAEDTLLKAGVRAFAVPRHELTVSQYGHLDRRVNETRRLVQAVRHAYGAREV